MWLILQSIYLSSLGVVRDDCGDEATTFVTSGRSKCDLNQAQTVTI